MAALAPAPAAPLARSPGYYVRQRLWQNRPAVAGLGFIALCTLLALLGYWVLPDNSPNANHGFVQLQKQPPGFRAAFARRPLPPAVLAARPAQTSSLPGSTAASPTTRKPPFSPPPLQLITQNS